MDHLECGDDAVDLAELEVILWRALEIGTDHAHLYFDDLGVDVEPCLFANLTRHKMLTHLKGAGLDLLDLINNGIQIEYRGYSIKVLKSDDGGLPAPGPSNTKQRFYQQTLKLDDETDLIMSPEQYRNLIICWDVDNDYMATSLTLYCPRSGDESTAHALWSRPIPHPGETGDRKSWNLSPTHPEDDDDLDITAQGVAIEPTGTGEND